MKHYFHGGTFYVDAKQLSYTFLLFFLFSISSNAQVFTTITDGDWSDASVWMGGIKPGTSSMSNMTVNINNRIEINQPIVMSNNSAIVINEILIMDGSALTMEEETSIITISTGLLVITNGGCLNKKGLIHLDRGAIQVCNTNFTDESDCAGCGTTGLGYIYANNGNIENKGTSPWSADIEWCSLTGGHTGMVIPENCAFAAPSSGICTDETYYAMALPVELISFQAKSNGCHTNLIWSTAKEEDFSHFEVQHATEQKSFETIYRIEGNGGLFTQHYFYEDKSPAVTNYYRLKMIDLDGTFEYSETVVFNSPCNNKDNKIQVFPSPIPKGSPSLNVKIKRVLEPTHLLVTNFTGEVLQTVEVLPGSTSRDLIELDIHQLPAGMYYIHEPNANIFKSFVILE